MPVVSPTVLKTYFVSAYPTTESNYIDLIDSLSHTSHLHDSEYHRKDQNIINTNGMRIGSGLYTPTAGVIYAADYVVALGGLFAGQNTDPGSGVIKATQSIQAGTFLDAGSYVNADDEYRLNDVRVGLLDMYTTSTYKTNSSWDGSSTHTVGVYTLTPANFGYPSTAKALYALLGGRTSTGSGYLGLNDDSTIYEYPLYLNTDTNFKLTYGIVHLNGSGNMILRIGTNTSYVKIQIWGAFI